MKQKPIISIIVPVYNTAPYLEKCFDSIAKQTYTNIEVLVVDDGSTDGSGEICDEYAKKDARFKIIHNKNSGVSVARNTALERAQGAYIGFVDSDDFVKEDMYESLYNNLVENKAELSICGQTKVYNDRNESEYFYVKQKTVFTKEQALEEVLLQRAFLGGPCNKLFDASLCKGIFFDEDIGYGEDLLFVVKNLVKCNRVVYDPISYYMYVIRSNSACTEKFTEKTFSAHIARERILQIVAEMESDKLLEIAYTGVVIADIALLGKLCKEKQMKNIYGDILKKSIDEKVNIKRFKRLTFFQKIEVLSVKISVKMFFFVLYIKEKIKLMQR